MRIVVALLKMFSFSLITLPMAIAQVIVLLFFNGQAIYILPKLWHKLICHVFCIKVNIIGNPEKNRQTFFVSNHISYLDIPVIGSILTGSFVAKEDVRTWPVFGFLARLQQTAFISRTRENASREKLLLANLIQDKRSLIVFPEGTSTEGISVLPFKSSLFAIAYDKDSPRFFVQPFTIRIISIDCKMPDTQADRDIYAWHINMDTPLGKHLWRFAMSKGAEISLIFHPLLDPMTFIDRKVLAKHCQETVSKALI